jgi:hypothetical protein
MITPIILATVSASLFATILDDLRREEVASNYLTIRQ